MIAPIGSTLYQRPLQRGLRLTEDRTAGPTPLSDGIILLDQDLFQNPALPLQFCSQLSYNLFLYLNKSSELILRQPVHDLAEYESLHRVSSLWCILFYVASISLRVPLRRGHKGRRVNRTLASLERFRHTQDTSTSPVSAWIQARLASLDFPVQLRSSYSI